MFVPSYRTRNLKRQALKHANKKAFTLSVWRFCVYLVDCDLCHLTFFKWLKGFNMRQLANHSSGFKSGNSIGF